jgi:hypothetical protein
MRRILCAVTMASLAVLAVGCADQQDPLGTSTGGNAAPTSVDAGNRPYDVAIIPVRNNSKSAVTVDPDATTSTRGLLVIGIYLLRPEEHRAALGPGFGAAPLISGAFSRSLLGRGKAVTLRAGESGLLLVRVQVAPRYQAGVLNSVTISYSQAPSAFAHTYALHYAMCREGATAPDCQDAIQAAQS